MDSTSLHFSPFQSVTLHANLGDIKLELHCDLVPKTCEVSSVAAAVAHACPAKATHVLVRVCLFSRTSWLDLCGSGYYNDSVFHQ